MWSGGTARGEFRRARTCRTPSGDRGTLGVMRHRPSWKAKSSWAARRARVALYGGLCSAPGPLLERDRRFRVHVATEPLADRTLPRSVYPDPPLTGKPKWEVSIGGGDQFIDPVMFDHWYVKVAVCYKAGPNAYSTYYWNWPTTTTNTVAWVGPLYSPGPNPAIIGRRPLEPGPGGLGRRHARLSVLRCCAHTERDRPGDRRAWIGAAAVVSDADRYLE